MELRHCAWLLREERGDAKWFPDNFMVVSFEVKTGIDGNKRKGMKKIRMDSVRQSGLNGFP